MQTSLLPSDKKSEIFHQIAPLQMLYIMSLTSTFKVTKFEMWLSGKLWRLAKMLNYDFYKDWYLPSNGTIAIGILRDLDLHFQGQTCSYAFVIKNEQRQRMSPAHLLRFAWSPLWSCSCYISLSRANTAERSSGSRVWHLDPFSGF